MSLVWIIEFEYIVVTKQLRRNCCALFHLMMCATYFPAICLAWMVYHMVYDMHILVHYWLTMQL
jgi:hypothetical protein